MMEINNRLEKDIAKFKPTLKKFNKKINMNTYIIYFEIFGKKMKTIVNASSKLEAKKVVKNKIIFHKIEGEENIAENNKDEFFDLNGLKNIFGMH